MGLELLDTTDNRIRAATLWRLAPLFERFVDCEEAWTALCEQPQYWRMLAQAGLKLRNRRRPAAKPDLDPDQSFMLWCIVQVEPVDGPHIYWEDWREWPIFQPSRWVSNCDQETDVDS